MVYNLSNTAYDAYMTNVMNKPTLIVRNESQRVLFVEELSGQIKRTAAIRQARA